jgi:hypothetical protein
MLLLTYGTKHIPRDMARPSLYMKWASAVRGGEIYVTGRMCWWWCGCYWSQFPCGLVATSDTHKRHSIDQDTRPNTLPEEQT